MSFAVNVHKLFWLDVAEAKNYYESVSNQISDSFDDALDKAYRDLIQNPEAYFNLSKQIRRIPLSNFPYQIIYTVRKDTIYILCLHQAASNKKNGIKESRH